MTVGELENTDFVADVCCMPGQGAANEATSSDQDRTLASMGFLWGSFVHLWLSLEVCGVHP